MRWSRQEAQASSGVTLSAPAAQPPGTPDLSACAASANSLAGLWPRSHRRCRRQHEALKAAPTSHCGLGHEPGDRGPQFIQGQVGHMLHLLLHGERGSADAAVPAPSRTRASPCRWSQSRCPSAAPAFAHWAPSPVRSPPSPTGSLPKQGKERRYGESQLEKPWQHRHPPGCPRNATTVGDWSTLFRRKS
jgi:hypothetical protein